MDAPDKTTQQYKKNLLSGFDHEMSIAREIMFGTKLDLSILDQHFNKFGPNGADVESLLEDFEKNDANSATSNPANTDNNDVCDDKDNGSQKLEIPDILQTNDTTRAEEGIVHNQPADETRKRTIKEEILCDERDSNCNFTKRAKPNENDSNIKVEAPESGRSVEKSEPTDDDFDWSESHWSQYIPADLNSETDQSRCMDDDFEWESPQWSQYEPIN